jgi:hypothetical protein
MSDTDAPLPDNPDFYTSPLKLDAQAAIGRFITAWAAVEFVIPWHVAKLIASADLDEGEGFPHAPLIRGVAALSGTPASAALMQLRNLAVQRKDEIKAAADKILSIKPKRDAVAHSLAGARGADVTMFDSFGASRVNMGSSKPYSVADMDRWCHELKSNARKIDTIVSELTGWTWKRIQEDQPRWLQSLRERGVKIEDTLPHLGSVPPAND